MGKWVPKTRGNDYFLFHSFSPVLFLYSRVLFYCSVLLRYNGNRSTYAHTGWFLVSVSCIFTVKHVLPMLTGKEESKVTSVYYHTDQCGMTAHQCVSGRNCPPSPLQSSSCGSSLHSGGGGGPFEPNFSTTSL